MIPANTCNQRTPRFNHSLMEKSKLAPPVSRKPVWTQQQRNMNLRFPVTYVKRHLDDWIQAFRLQPFEVTCGVEDQTIYASGEIVAGEKLGTTAVTVGARGIQRLPVAGRLAPFQLHRHVASGFAPCQIEDVS